MKVNASVKFNFPVLAEVSDEEITSIARQNAINMACAGRNLDGRQMEVLSRSANVRIKVDISRLAGSPTVNVSVSGTVEGSYQ